MIDEQTWRKSTCTPHISKLGWEYLEINEITFLQPREENSNDVVGEVISILLRNKLRTRDDVGSRSYQEFRVECLAKKVKWFEVEY